MSTHFTSEHNPPQNPYIAGNSVGSSPAFVGRVDILKEVERVVRHPHDHAIVLYGQRRIGKTSVLRELEAKLSKDIYCPVFFDLLDKAQLPLEWVLRELAHKISDVLHQSEPDLEADPEVAFRKVWLPEVLNNLPQKKSLVLLFDEFDVLANPNDEKAGADFFPYLRELLEIDHQRLNFVFVIGRKIDDLSNIVLSLFKGTPIKHVSLLEREETFKLVRLSETNNTLQWTEETIEKIWQQAGGHPYLTQRWCSRVWDNIYDKSPDKLPIATLEDVNTALPDAFKASQGTLAWLWDGLGPAERFIASALASAGIEPMTAAQLEHLLKEKGVQMVLEELQNAPHLLQEWDLIEPTKSKGYRFRVELLRRWIAKYKPLSRVQKELDRIKPVADNFYKAGVGLFHGGQLQEAVSPLRQAIGLNPNHVGASKLLANILLAEGQPNEAREILEQLYPYQPEAARPRLIQALLDLARTTKNEDEQLKYYERILELDADHQDAKMQRQKIWQQRGDKAYKNKDLKAALQAYKTAGLDEKVVQIEQEMRHYNEMTQTKQNKKEQRKVVMKGIRDRYLKGTLEIVGFALILAGSYYWLTDRIPTEPLIVLEVEQLANKMSEYAITGVVSDKPYSLDTVKILPHCDHPVKQATFKYDIFTPAVDLKVNPNTQPPTYWVDKALLQQTLAEKDKHFSFEFLDQERFTFSFQFEAPETTPAEFECNIFTADNRNVPCQVREKGYLSLFRGIPWFGIGSILGIILIVLIEIVYAFKKRRPNVSHQKY